MSDEVKGTYTPEPGSSLARSKKTEELDKGEAGMREAGGEPNEDRYDPYGRHWEQIMLDLQDRDLRRDDIHFKRRVKDPKYKEMDSVQVDNKRFQYLQEQKQAGNKRPDEEIEAEFYRKVYRAYEPYIRQRLEVNPEERLHNITQDFLDGEDLERKVKK